MRSSPLGSVGTTTDASRDWISSEIYDSWGQRWAYTGTLYAERFAGLMKRDAESGLNPTQNRMLNSNYGRWLTPDPGGLKVVTLTDPQTWNMYAYSRNNPTTLNDPSGLIYATPSGGSDPFESSHVYTGTLDFIDQGSAATGPGGEKGQGQGQKLSENGLKFIECHEAAGCNPNLTPYTDQAGNPTIGYGHKIKPREHFSSISKEKALQLLKQDIKNAVREVSAGLSVAVTQRQFDALVSLAFNAGPKSVMSGNEMMRAVNSGWVHEENFTAYRLVSQDGRYVVSQGLLKRREDEWEMYSGGGRVD